MKDPDDTEIQRLKPGTRFECHDPVTGELAATGRVKHVGPGRVYVALDKQRVYDFETRNGERVRFMKSFEETSWAPETLVTPVTE